MVITYNKLVKPDGKAPDELEKQIANALTELSNADDLKGRLTELYIVGAQVCFVPYIDLRQFPFVHVSDRCLSFRNSNLTTRRLLLFMFLFPNFAISRRSTPVSSVSWRRSSVESTSSSSLA